MLPGNAIVVPRAPLIRFDRPRPRMLPRTMPARHALILTALEFEARPIARTLGLRFDSRAMAGGDGRVRLRVVGPRATRLPASPDAGCALVVMAGLAGGLSPELRRGDLVIDESSDAVTTPASQRGAIATVDRVASTPADKATLRRATGALAVDMENATVRAWARRHGAGFVGVRVISDTAGETLDPATLRIVDDRGALRPTSVVGELLRRPAFAMALWDLRSTRGLVDTLAASVRAIVESRSSD